MALIKCPECGADVSEKASACPKCGCPCEIFVKNPAANKKVNYKMLIVAVLLVAALALTGFGIYRFMNRPDTSGYYKGFKWGMSFEKVKKQLGDEAAEGDIENYVSTSIEDYEGKTGVDAVISYNCEDDTLKSIMITILNGDDSSYTDESLLDEYTEQFNKLYGEYEKSLISYIWNTEKSKISLIYLTDGCFILKYEDITQLEEE